VPWTGTGRPFSSRNDLRVACPTCPTRIDTIPFRVMSYVPLSLSVWLTLMSDVAEWVAVLL
jgi:hypothetical protein